jgi:rare lipoprotein A
MQLNLKSRSALSAVTLLLSSCGHFDGVDRRAEGAKAPRSSRDMSADEGVIKVGQPYEIAGETYNPADNAQYDEVGYASWYGEEAGGNPTANGEAFNPAAISAAHATLPMPSYAEITRLDNGKTILVRINDRGPFAKGRIVDLSRGAAQLLGMEGQGAVPVRVRRVNPPEQEKTALRLGQKAADRLDTPDALLVALRRKLGTAPVVAASVTPRAPSMRPPPVQRAAPVGRAGASYETPTDKPKNNDRFVIEDGSGRRTTVAPVAPSDSGYFIQIAAFSNQARAVSLAKQLGARVEQAGSIWRVRKGPYGDEESARTALGPIAAKGYRDARVTR